MAFKLQGYSGKQVEVEANTRAVRITPKPLDVGAFGTYRTDTVTGTMAAGLAGASEVFQFRWTDATRVAFIRGVKVSMQSLGTGFTAGIGLFNLFVARSWTVDGSGGTALTLTGVNDLRTDFANPLVGTVRQASTAALGAGTKTLDTYAMASAVAAVPATTNYAILPTMDLYLPDLAAGEHPIILEANEGFAIQATVPATGTWSMRVTTTWNELLEY